MRKSFLLLALLALALPVVGVAGQRTGDGTLAVESGRGVVTLTARGGVIGRLDRGSVTIHDLTPGDNSAPNVFGDDNPVRLVGETGIRYSGTGIRFRVTGGRYRIVVDGKGINLSAVGKGFGSIQGEGDAPGLYSLDGDDCRKTPAACKALPDVKERFQLGPDDKSPGRNEG